MDQRGVQRPQNRTCDIGAYEYEGQVVEDTEPPDTLFDPVTGGPFQNTEATSMFLFSGTDNLTHPEDLTYECRLIEYDPTEPPEPVDPTEPPAPEFAFVGCTNPWQVPLIEDGLYLFEVRAIDRAGNIDPTPVSHSIVAEVDVTPPQTTIETFPSDPSSSQAATFTFSASDDATPVQFIEFECRLDSNDPAAWLECTNPAVLTNLAPGSHTFQVRAADGADNVDPTPASYTWTVAPATTCDSANITLFAQADTWVDEALPTDNMGILENLVVRSAAPGADARTLIKFVLPPLPAECELQSATLRLWGEGDPGDVLQATPLGAAWGENQVTWLTQPSVDSGATPATTTAPGAGYRTWNVTPHVAAMRAGTDNHGWLIRYTDEEGDPARDQSFIGSEVVGLDPPTPPQLVLRFEPDGAPAPEPPTMDPGTTPTQVTCGQILTSDTIVANDLNCLGEGLVIGAPDIVVDLNGRTVAYAGILEPGEEDGLFAGIRNSDHDNVVITGGTVRNYGYGVRLMGTVSHNVITGMTLANNVNAGVELFDADNGRIGNTISGNTFRLNGDGVALVNGAEGSLVEGNTFAGNLGRAVYVFDGGDHQFLDNDISGETGDPLLDSDGGFYLDSSTDNEIAGNTISDTGDAAVVLTGAHRTNVHSNRTSRTSDSGITVADSDGVRLVENSLHRAGGPGIAIADSHSAEVRANDVRYNPGGIELSGSDNAVVESNDARFSSAYGISLEATTESTVRANIVDHTQGAGIAVEGEVLDAAGDPIGGNLVEGNSATGNLGDGISVNGGGHTVTANTAYNNGAWGIAAEVGTTVDGGGNLASGNAEPGQCIGVVCADGTAPPVLDPDLSAPDTEVTDAPANGTGSLSPHRFTFRGVDDQAPETALRYECRIDAPPDGEPEPPEPPEPGEPPEPVEPPASETWGECGSPWVYPFLLAGEHRFEVRAIDPADNVDLTPAVHVWTVSPAPASADSLAPRLTIASSPENPTSATNATIVFRATDDTTPGSLLTYQCSVDGSAAEECTSPLELTDLSLGTHSVIVTATDLAGNVSAPAEVTWEVVEAPQDTTAPETTLVSTPDPTTVLTSAELSFTSTEAGAGFECRLDADSDADWTSCTSPQTYDNLDVGSHTFDVRAIDAAGNVDPTPASFSWEITAAPVETALTCGTVVTQSIRLTADLLDCPGDGIVVGADRITIDLGGQVVGGTGTGESVGIRFGGFDSVTVTGGTVEGFDTGISLGSGTVGAIVDTVTVSLNLTSGVTLTNADDGSTGSTLRSSEIVGNSLFGVLLDNGTQYARVHDNIISGTSGTAISVLHSSDNRVEDNDISNSSDTSIHLDGSTGTHISGNSVQLGADAAIMVELGSHNTRVEGNHLTDSEAGVIVSESNGAHLVDNVIHTMGDNAISLEASDGGLVHGNDVRFNTGGISVEGSSGNRIEANDASQNDGYGIELGDGALSNQLVGNTASSNASDGISIGGDAPAGSGTLIESNTAHANAGDGIHVGGVGHMIARNVADNNTKWGIYSSLGTVAGTNVDGGGNRGAGNLGGSIDPTTLKVIQCHNVACDGGPGLPSDTTPPQTSIVSGPSDLTSRTSATITFTGTDNATTVTFECGLDGASWEPCTSPVTLTGLSVAAHSFAVRAIDWLGNPDPTPAIHTWTIEPPAPGTAPTTTILDGPDPMTVSTTATFTFESDEEGTSFSCSLDGSQPTTCASPHQYSGLAVGPHTFTVFGTDPEGNIETSPATYSWTVGPAPVATTVSCGMTVTQSIRLLNDLTDCGGDALVVGAGGITIDLDGHVLDGTGLGAGVRNPGFDGVAVTNGSIQEFDHGVLVVNADRVIVSSLRLTATQESGVTFQGGGSGSAVRSSVFIEGYNGVWLTDAADGVVVRDNTLAGLGGSGVRIDLGAARATVSGNSVTGASGAAILLEGATDNLVETNDLSTNPGAGVALDLAANANLVRLNTITGSGSAGISVTGSDANSLLGNVVSGSGSDAISLDSANLTVISTNDIRFNSGGVSLTSSSDNTLVANSVIGNSGSGISVESESFRNVIRANVVSSNSGEGIYLAGQASGADGNLVVDNLVDGQSGAGILVNDSGHTVTGNSASANDGWGIYANGAIDGGGNRAGGNAEPQQCFGVVCEILDAPGAPDTVIVEAPDDPSNTAFPYFTFTGSDDTTAVFDLGFQCRLDSSDELDFVDCENPWYLSNLSPGEHTFEVRAVDQNDRVDPTPASHTWVYEALPANEPPDTFIDLKPTAQTPLLEAFFTFSSNEPDVTYECSLDEAAFSACVFGVEYEFDEAEVGAHTFRVRATDSEGLVDPTPAEWTWVITGITTTITGGPAFIAGEGTDPAEGGETEESSATFEFFSNLPDADFLCSIDLGAYEPCASGVTYDGLVPGEHLFTVYAVGPEGEEQLEPTEYGWMVLPGLDITPPETQMVGGGTDANGGVTFTFIGTDDRSASTALTFECAIDDSSEAGPWTECTSPWTYPSTENPEPLSLGQHTFYVRAIDTEDNVDATPAEWDFVIEADGIAPTVSVTAAPPAQTAEQVSTLRFTSNDPFATFECALDPVGEAVYEPCSSPHEVSVDVAGPHTVLVRAVDLAGNAGEPAEVSWTLMAAPEVVITTTFAAASGPDVQIAFTTVPEFPGPTFECSLDGGPFASCTSPVSHTGLGGGQHTVQVRGTFGAFVGQPAEITWVVDAPVDEVAPDTTITVGPVSGPLPIGSTSASATFEFSATEAGVTFECDLDGSGFSGCLSPHVIDGLTAGEHTVLVRAVDAAGNVDATAASWTWEVDGHPAATILSGPDEVTGDVDATFEFTTAEGDATFECWLDGTAQPCTSPQVYTGLAAGDHVFAVRALDPDVPVDLGWPEYVDYEWTIAAVPDTTVLSAPTGTINASATIEFTGTGTSFQCALDGADYATCTSPAVLNELAVGTHTFAVRSVNAAGMPDPTPVTVEFEVAAPAAVCEASTVTLNASRDSWVNSGSTAENKGTDSNLKVMSKSGGNLRALVGFPAWQVPEGCVIESATLRMYAGSARTGRTLQALNLNGAWTETAVTWANQPATTGTAATVSSGTGWRQWTVTEQVSAALSAGTWHGFLIRDAQENRDAEQQFWSREKGQNVPQLVVAVVPASEAAPEPSPSPSPSPSPTPIETCPAPVTLTASADAWIQQKDTGKNNGADSNLKVMSKSGEALRALVRFDLPATPAGCSVTSATLRLYSTGYKTGRTLQAIPVAAAWTEGGVTWATQPTTTGSTSTVSSGSGWRVWNITGQLTAGVAAHGFLVRDANEGNDADQQFTSREGSSGQRPQLVIEYVPSSG
ncbi:MAG: right-handed parallel beta-helix repeat-containing protein [Dermatophilaceae bacterium]